MTIITITGHREILEDDQEIIRDRLLAQIASLMKKYPRAIFKFNDEEVGVDLIVKQCLVQLGAPYHQYDKCNATEEKEITEFYEVRAKEIVSISNHIVAVWDGILSFESGSTSDIVKKAIDSDRRIQIHHLITPQKENPYPVHSLNEEVIDFQNGKFNRVPFAFNYGWISFRNSAHAKKKRKLKNTWLNREESLLGVYLLPVLLVLMTLILGFIGFQDYFETKESGYVNNIFNAAQLLMLELSDIENRKDEIHPALNIARFIGLIFLIYAFFYGFYLALGDKRALIKLKYWQSRKNFNIVIGLNLESKYLINDLIENLNQKVVLLYQDDNDALLEELKSSRKVIVIKGNLTSRRTLASLFPNQAKNIYIMSTQDDVNLRASQELDVIRNSKIKNASIDQFIRIENSFKRKFLHDTLSDNSAARSNIFDFKSNIVRRLLLLFPIDRFHQTPNVTTAQVVILGFNKLGEELLLTILKQGHYTRDKFLQIDVICNHASERKAIFYADYNTIKSINSNSKSIIEQYTWSNIKLNFHEKKNSPQFWLSDVNPIYKNIKKESILTIYSTDQEAIQSASFINIFLPKLNIEKDAKCNLQMYIHYNLPDKKETIIIEDYFNRQAPRIPVKCFGNFTDECKQKSVHNMALDALPKLIHASYSDIEIEETTEVNRVWNLCNEKEKDSSRQAADHLWVKIRTFWSKIDFQFDSITFEPKGELSSIIKTPEFQQEFNELEHRRWCAELLLKGFKPLIEDTSSTTYKDISKRWGEPEYEQTKNEKLQLFQHIDLVPYKDLSEKEAEKDLKQLKNVSAFLRALIRTDETENDINFYDRFFNRTGRFFKNMSFRK